MLVVDKQFAATQAFQDFIEGYNRAVDRLNDQKYLAELLEVDEKWLENKNIKFLKLEETGEKQNVN